MDSIQLIDLGPPTAAAAAPAAHGRTSVYEDGGHSGPAAYETDGDMYEDGAVGPNPDGLGPMLYTSQPRGVNGMPLGPEPDPVIPADAPPSAAAQRMPEMNEIEPDTHVAERRRSIIVRGTPLPKWFRTVAEASALVYLVLAIISIVERNVFDGLFFGSITSTALAMELALRGASPPALPGNFCGGHGPNNKPATWFVVGILWLVVANLVAWTVPGHMHLKVYGVAFLLWTGFDLFLLIVMQEFRIFGFDALIVFILFIFNVMFQYEEYTQDEETFIAFCCLVVVVHLPLNILQITYHDDCNQALRARLLPRWEPDEVAEDDVLITSAPVDNTLGVGRRVHGAVSPNVQQFL